MKAMRPKFKIPYMFYQIFVMLLIIIVGILLSSCIKTRGIILDDNIETRVEYSDDREIQYNSKNFGQVNKGDMVYVTLHMPETSLVEHPTIRFYIYHATVDISVDGQVIDSYGYDAAKDGVMIGRNNVITELPADIWGKDVEICFRVKENNAFNQINHIYLYESKDSFFYNYDVNPLNLFIGIPMLLIGLISILVSFIRFKWTKASRKGAYISSFIILISFYLILANGLESAFGFDNNVFSQLEFISIYIVPIPVLLYAYETNTTKRIHKILEISIIVESIFFIIATILNITNIAHYCDLLSIANILLISSGVVLVAFAISQRKISKSNKIFFDGIIMIAIIGVYDIVRISLRRIIGNELIFSLPSLISIGILVFTIYIVLSFAQSVKDNHDQLIVNQTKMNALDKLVKSIPTGICLVRLDNNLSIMGANNRFYQILGYVDADTKNGLLSFFSVENQQKIIDLKDDLINNNKNIIEIEMELKDSKIVQNILFKMAHLFDDNYITINLIDITNQKLAEKKLKVSDEHYRLALEQSGKIFFYYDIESKTVTISDELAKKHGVDPKIENIPDQYIEKGLISEESIDDFKAFFKEIQSGKKSGSVIVSGCRPYTKQLSWLEIEYTTIFDYQNKPIGAVLTYEDISGKRKKELDSKWHEIDLLADNDYLYATYVYDATNHQIVDSYGDLTPNLSEIGEFEKHYRYVENNSVHKEYKEAFKKFFNINRIIELYNSGINEDTIEYLSRQRSDNYRWVKSFIQIVKDNYSDHIIIQFKFFDIDESKTGIYKLQKDYDSMKDELERSRIKVMVNQMQPHFLYNALSAIRTITKRDPDYAYDLLYDFSIHLRSSIKALSSDEPIPFKDELANIEAYLNIERMRQGERLKIQYDIEIKDFKIIPLSIQPIVENAVRHGIFMKGEQGGTVLIRTYEDIDNIIIQVKDDGVGFDYKKVLATDNDSVGIKSLIFRLKTLMNANVEVYSVINEGTLVTVYLPKGAENNEDNLN